VQKITNMLALTTNHFESHKNHCTRTKEEIDYVKTHLGELIKEMKDVDKKNTNIEELTRATKQAVREEAAVTRKASEDRLQRIERQVSELTKVAAKTQTQMNTISSNLSSVMALIAAKTSRGNELIRNVLPQNTSPENGNWDYAKTTEDGNVQTSDAQDVEQTRKDTKEHRLREQFRSLANPPPGTMDDSDESSNTSEHGKQHNPVEAEEEETSAHKSPEGTGEAGDFGANKNGAADA
jgi:uncharacterized coiled-coil protein SlyX